MDKWISVKKELPKESGSYLVSAYHDSGNGEDCAIVLNAWYNVDNFGYDKLGWTLLNEFYDLTPQIRDEITHWRKYPEPVTPESELWEDFE